MVAERGGGDSGCEPPDSTESSCMLKEAETARGIQREWWGATDMGKGAARERQTDRHRQTDRQLSHIYATQPKSSTYRPSGGA